MRRALPAVTWALAMLLIASAAPVQGGSSLFHDGFERGLRAWRVTEPPSATVATVPGAATAGELGLRVSSGRGVVAGVAHRLDAPLKWTRIAVDVRRGTRDAARIAGFRGDSGWVLVASVNDAGRLRLSGDGWSVATDVRLPLDRWVRLAIAADGTGRRVTVLTNGKRRAELRRRTGPVGNVSLAGGQGPRILAFDRFVLDGAPVDPAPTPTPEPTPEPPTEYRFEGRGSDHGVGMSQLGAVGRARAGQTHEEILDHYYRATTLDTRPTLEGRLVRVLLLDRARATAAAPLLVCGRQGQWTIEGLEERFGRGACARVRSDADGALVEVVAGDGTQLYEGPGRDVMMVPLDEATRLEVPAEGARDLYRGSIRVLAKDGRAKVVNHVTMGDYLRGVVPAEMGSSRPGAALRAQAIVSRSYAARQLNPDRGIADITDGTRNQVYDGVAVEADATDTAIARTAGVVVTYEGRIADTLYHAAGGGATEDARNVFTVWDGSRGWDEPYLRGSLDVDANGDPYDAPSSYDHWQTAAFTLAQLSRIMRGDPRTDVGSIRRLVLDDRGVSGRLTSVTLVGEDGTRKTVAGWYFKQVYNEGRLSGDPLVSTLFFLQPAA